MEVWVGHGQVDRYFRRPGLDVWVWSETSKAVDAGGGDLHLISSCASGRITRMLLADICGDGQLFEEVSADFRKLMRRNVNSLRHTRVVRQMSEQLDELAQRGGFASTLLGSYLSTTRTLHICNAGHPPPFVYRRLTGDWSTLKSPAPGAAAEKETLGTVHPLDYQQFATKLAPGDLVLSCSNALTECKSGTGSTLGQEGLLQRLRKLEVAQPQQLIKQLVNRLRQEHPANSQATEISLLLCCCSRTQVGWKNSLLAPFRVVCPWLR